jgi:hypothetical protein
VTAVDDFIKAEPKRDGKGRYLIKGRPYTRATTFAGVLDDRHNLELWQQRMVATGLVARPDLLAAAAADFDDKNRLNQICEDAIEAAKGKAKANLGTALHTMTERVDRGENFVAPAPWDKDIAAYREGLAAAGLRVLPGFIEGIVVNHKLDVAGTFDRIVGMDGRPLPKISDLKTGSVDHSWLSIAIQQAIYANAEELYDPGTDTTSPMPEVDKETSLIIHLPAGEATCTIYELDIAAGWEAAQVAIDVRKWRSHRKFAVPFTSPTAERLRWLAGRAQKLKADFPQAFADLAASWPFGCPTFKAGGHTDDDLTRIALAISAVESKHSVPFGDPDPLTEKPAQHVIDQLHARMRDLPADLLEQLRTDWDGMPGVGSPRFTVGHVPEIEKLIEAAEALHTERHREVITMLSLAYEGAEHRDAVVRACGSDGERWTETHLAILGAFTYIGVVTFENGVAVIPDAENLLVKTCGTKRDALAAAKDLAETHGLAKPKSVADAALNPALVALVVAKANDNQGAPTT